MTLENPETPSKNAQAGPPSVGKGLISELGPTEIQSEKSTLTKNAKSSLQQVPEVAKQTQQPIPKEKYPSKVEQIVEQKLPPPLPARPIVPPVTNLPSGVVLPTTPLQPQQLNCSIRPHKMAVVAPPTNVAPSKSATQSQSFTSTVSPTTIQAMLANVKPVVSMAAVCGGRSTLRNYRRSKNQPPEPMKTDTTNGNKSFQTVIGSRALPSDISVTPIISKVSSGNDVKRPIEHQPPSVSCYPINKEVEKVEKVPMSIDDLVAAKKLKDEQAAFQSPSQQNNRSFQIPKGLTITEISSGSKSNEKGPVNYEVQALPVLHIPEVSTGDHYDLLKRFDEVDLPNEKKSTKTNGMLGGHPGMPNGLLRMTASLQQKSDYSRPGVGKIQTKVTPKDLKSQLALNKIGFSMDKNSNNGNPMTQQNPNCTSTITVSMAQSAASAVSVLNSKLAAANKDKDSKHKHRNFNGGPNKQLQQSPVSSHPSSRNSSISPRDRVGPVSINARSISSSRQSPSLAVTPKQGGSGQQVSQVSPKPLFRSSSSMKKKSTQFVGPLIPWANRNCGPPKHSNGWSWVGEGTEQVIFLNVSFFSFNFFNPNEKL